MDAQRRTAEVELEREARGDIVLLVRRHHREVADLLDQLGVADHVAREVGVVAHAGVHTDEPGELCGIVRGILQCGPGRFQEHALLRVHQRGHLGVHAEEAVVELVRIGDHTARLHVVGVVAQLGGYARVDLVGRPRADAVLFRQQVLPKLLHVRGAGETAAHADDGDIPLGRDMFRPDAGLRHLSRGHGARIALQERRARPDRRVLVQFHDRQFQAMSFQLGHALDAQQRVAAEVEEVVVDARAVDAQQIGPYVGERFLHGALRRSEGHIKLGSFHIGRGQCLAVDLATGGAGQFLHRHEGRRLHVVGQEGGEVLAQFVRAEFVVPRRSPGGGGLRDVITDQALQSGTVLADVGHGLFHSGVLFHGHFHFAELDAVAAHLHLAVDAALVVDLTVGQFRSAVAGLVHATAGNERIREETFGGKVITTDVAFRHASAAEVELAFFPLLHRLHLLIEHVQLHVVDGLADVGQCRPGGRIALQFQLAHHVAFGGAVLVAEAAAGQLFEEVDDRRGDLQLLTTGEDLFQ